MASISLIITILIIVVLTAYIVFYRIYPGPDNKQMMSEQMPLNEKKNILMPDRTQTEILGSGGTSVMGFIYLGQGDKTLRYGPADQYIPLLQVENNWALEIIPSPKDKKEFGARLRVKTQRAGQLSYEIISLPSIPKQKWVWFALLREGRRFDVIYDKRLVASQRLEHYPAVIASPLSIGNKGIEGAAIHWMVNSHRLTPEEVERERKTYVDTNGKVVESTWNPLTRLEAPSLPFPRLSAQCPAGLPCETVTAPPKRSLYEWKTPYA
jgi:hypothetical protein